jgi:hypothetical protein
MPERFEKARTNENDLPASVLDLLLQTGYVIGIMVGAITTMLLGHWWLAVAIGAVVWLYALVRFTMAVWHER